jgi:hypothetical protein
MKGDRHPARLAVAEAREQVLERLSNAFAQDQLGLEEFEARVDGAYQASTEPGLQALVRDLAPLPAPARTELVTTTTPSTAPPRVIAVLGNVERRGRFRLASGYRATSVLGNIELDLRDATLEPGVTELRVRAVLGNIEIIVPPQLAVECEGSGILASFATLNRMPAEGGEGGPVLRIVGSAVLGNVEIRTLPRGVPLSSGSRKALPAKGEGTP